MLGLVGMTDDDDWDLGAVVRGCRASGTAAVAAAAPRLNNFASFTPQATQLDAGEPEDDKGGSFFAFPDLFPRQDAFQELEELYKAFSKDREQRTAALCPSEPPHTTAVAVAGSHQTPVQPRQPHRLISQMPRSKRRKNLQKKVVCHVPAAGLSSDVWAWRKYGQKPIKGSPYPRGYYRCSSSKTCLARKQVERSRADPAMFIITYTAEHNHPVPTHRNSLAGSTRHKFASPAPAGSNGDHGSASGPSTSSSTAAGLSPTTPLTVSMDEELLRRLPQEAELDGEELVEDEADEDDGVLLLVEDMEVAGEDDFLFMGVTQDTAAASTGTEESDLLHFLATTAGTTSSLPVAM